mmetsp:Transcript_10655/g.16151  ORF Transcript_10655/g.16151 Transcript_10655/m.16151 type:complete len:166 (-) Transcript_10655:59-556(-)
MGRYTTVQTYSDSNTKVVTASSSTAAETGPKKLQVEKVNNVMGSCAGAGSGEFDIYRAARRREHFRLEEIERQKQSEQQQKELEEKIRRNRLEAEERTRKNAEKRKKKKAKKEERKRKFEELTDTTETALSNDNDEPQDPEKKSITECSVDDDCVKGSDLEDLKN